MQDSKLIVKEVIPQASEKNLYGRSVRLDALCILGDGTRCNIEVQRSDNDDHLRRARYNASCITVKDSQTGTNFKDVIDLYIIYISEFDFLGEGKTTYHVDKIIRETGTVIDDGLHEIFVNAAIDDKSEIAELMSCFMQTEIDNPRFPVLSEETKRLKSEIGGLKAMCGVMDDVILGTKIETWIESLLDAEYSDSKIIAKLQEKCNISESEAKEQLLKFKANETSQQ